MSSISALSASVTRILSLTGFPKELKTKDIQSAFSEWENVAGGFKIKWVDDTSLYIVFQDPATAKRAYLKTVAYPPAIFTSPTTQTSAIIRPYDGPDAVSVIHAVNSRQHSNNNNSRGQRAQSMSVPSTHGRGMSVSNGFRGGNGNADAPGAMSVQTSHNGSSSFGREPSPTLPSLPSHPTLNSLIENSLGGAAALDGSDPAILAQGPRIGDPGKRMLGHALGVRHPGLPTRAGVAVADA
ncbi:hypothetical protein PUNSTDRAFT_80715 [Punctularia strigosozonata HHB-11173 SS5]|uniref:uncharacterized protein n=1 Tax=Punctularia strigosozonata (strain HHB-11173) TaxID=741275 RepID=UPI000441695F|nr:uncharacterized protein PUNSTDRAFT_80715 [Punctularia strigosozonata HHB-11173 SS5]EIN14391.1 hypothetical protein PUNSTDRAFT_80715 [Punctularia strigosozonata HHB-11173 SS5]